MKSLPNRVLTVAIVGGFLTVWTICLIRNIPSYDGTLDSMVGVSSLSTKTKHVTTLIVLGIGLCLFPFIALRAFRQSFSEMKNEPSQPSEPTPRSDT